MVDHTDKIHEIAESLANTQGEVAQLQATVINITNILENLKNADTINTSSYERRPHTDVIILHDSLFKYINEGIMKNERLSTRKMWSPRLDVLTR